MKNKLYIAISFLASGLFAQQQQTVDFKKGLANLTIDPHKKEVTGNIRYVFDVIDNTDSIFIDARKMTVHKVMLNAAMVDFYNDGAKLWLVYPFTAKTTHELEISYTANPEKAMYFIGWEAPEAKKQVWTQGQGKYTSHWLPSFDDVNEKVVFDLRIGFKKGYEVISNGLLANTTSKNYLNIWHYRMQKPMSSYLLALAIGKYDQKNTTSKTGIPISLYFYPEDTLKIEPTYRYTTKIFDFLEAETGVPYPWQNYKQIPVKDFLYAGMENTSATLFSDRYMIDYKSFNDLNYVNVNAHELAHQWFGNLVTAKSGRHHWLQEGFATYYALLAERELFGDDHYYWKLYQSAMQLIAVSDQGKGEHLLNPKAGSLTFYEKGAWALHILSERIGKNAFKKGVKSYLLQHQFQSVDTDDFIRAMEQESKQELSDFVTLWLEKENFPKKEALQSLRKNSFINTLLEVKQHPDINAVLPMFSEKNFFPLNLEIIAKCKDNSSDAVMALYRKILQSDLAKERQALAMTLDRIPIALQKDFESLLEDNSYLTIETALYKLWISFPEGRKRYLETTKGISGFNDKNVEMLWLTLALISPDYAITHKSKYYKKLSYYTASIHPYEVRQHAFRYLYELQTWSDESLRNLIQACLHDAWQFSKFSRRLLDMLLKDPSYRDRFEQLLLEINNKERAFLRKKIRS